MAPEKAMEHFKSRLYPLVEKLRDFKRLNPKLTRYENDWWFPIVSKDSQFTSQYISGTKSRGKSHDWKFHGKGLEDVIREHEGSREVQFDTNGNESVYTSFVITDVCASHYRCLQNFLNQTRICCKIFPNKIRIVHLIAAKYAFKGPWDADGGRSKTKLKNEETKWNRSPDSFTAFLTLVKTVTKTKCDLPIEDWIHDRDSRIIRKTPMMMVQRRYRYICNRRDEYDRSAHEYADDSTVNIIFLDRDRATRPSDPGKAISGTNKHYQFHLPYEHERASTETQALLYKLFTTESVCACIRCRVGRF